MFGNVLLSLVIAVILGVLVSSTFASVTIIVAQGLFVIFLGLFFFSLFRGRR